MTRPEASQVEVTVIGPSYGETVLVHFGGDQWCIVDSMVPSGRTEPAALTYLRSLGSDPATCVRLIVVTHWHDDHVKGISETVDVCSSAAICVPIGFTKEVFNTFLSAHSDPLASWFGTGVDEIKLVFEQMRIRGFGYYAIEDKRILTIAGSEMPHGQEVEVWSLSPSSFQFAESLGKLGTMIPELGRTKRRAVPTQSNDHSIVLWIGIGSEAVLLGGDLEETADVRAGWSAIVASRNRPQGRSSVFKVPHHGSSNGHNAAVWTEMLSVDPHAILTPWNRARKLPTRDDMARLNGLSANVHLTAPPSELGRVKHEHEVERLLRDFGIRTYRNSPNIGIVSARKLIGSPEWSISRSAFP